MTALVHYTLLTAVFTTFPNSSPCNSCTYCCESALRTCALIPFARVYGERLYELTATGFLPASHLF